MKLGKDIWNLIFEKLETNFCPYSLNSLSLTCKKLNSIDKERRERYSKHLNNKYSDILSQIQKYKETKGRFDYVTLEKYLYIGNCYVKETPYQNIKIYEHFPDYLSYLEKLKVKNFTELKQLSMDELLKRLEFKDYVRKDIELIQKQVYTKSDLILVFTYMKWDEDIVNSILDIQSTF